MGEHAKIEAGKTSSDAFTGCAPVDWVIKKAKDFGEWIGKGVSDLWKNITNEFGNFLRGTWEDLKGFGDWFGNLPVVKTAKEYTGTMIATGKKVIKSAEGCIKTTLAGLGIGMAVGATGGLIYLLSTGGILGSAITALTLGAFARWGLRAVAKVWRFNWNITDEQINNTYKSKLTALASQAGSVVGSALATVACGVGGAAVVAKVNPKALALIAEVQEEGWEEVLGNMKALISSAWSAAETWVTLEIYKNIRSAVKKISHNPAIAKLLPESWKKAIDYWGSKGSKPWSFASATEEAIDSIKNEQLKAFLEEAREEFAEVCSEQTYALSYGL